MKKLLINKFMSFSSYLHKSPLLYLSAMLNIFSFILVLTAFFNFINAIYLDFSVFDNYEESAYTFISSSNFIKYGFFNSSFLQDFSISPRAQDHPYVYDHMPAGPDVLVAMLLKISNNNYVIMRIMGGAITLVGFFLYVIFIYKFLKLHGVSAAGYGFIACWPPIITTVFARIVYIAVPLLFFAPILTFICYKDRNNKIYWYMTLLLILFSSLYIEYSLLSGIMASWLGGYLFRILPINKKEISIVLSIFLLGIAIHILQNFYFLGLINGFMELYYTVSNRITGYPSQQDLKFFYQSNGVLLHGASSIDLGTYLAQVIANYKFIIEPWFINLVLYVFISINLHRAFLNGKILESLRELFYDKRIELILRFMGWCVLSIGIPMVLFPAFAQEVNLSNGSAQFFYTILFSVVFGLAFEVMIEDYNIIRGGICRGEYLLNDGYKSSASKFVSYISLIKLESIIRLIILLIATTVALSQLGTVIQRAMLIFNMAEPTLIRIQNIQNVTRLRDFKGLFMTNINSPLVSYLMDSPGYGVCKVKITDDSMHASRDCKISLMRNLDYWNNQNPKYYVHFKKPEYFPGFADCFPPGFYLTGKRDDVNCNITGYNSVKNHFKEVLSNDELSVFDLEN